MASPTKKEILQLCKDYPCFICSDNENGIIYITKNDKSLTKLLKNCGHKLITCLVEDVKPYSE